MTKHIKQKDFKRFDMLKPPMRQPAFILLLEWLLCFPSDWMHRLKITKVNMEGLKPPYLLLCNHNSFLDFKVTTAAIFPHRGNYVAAIDGFLHREWLLRYVGLICKRKFTNDVILLYQLRRVIKNKDIAIIFPEARYSLCGTESELPDSLFGLPKFLKVPVVTLITHGNHVNSPFWNTKNRGAKPIEATMTQIITADEASVLPEDEVARRLNEKFVYDDWAWQRDNKIKITYKDRAKGLHKVLYRCPHCGTEYRMESSGDRIYCGSCGKTWIMDEYGSLKAESGETEFTHIPDWYNWERSEVTKEVREGKYSISYEVIVHSLPNTRGYINLGRGFLKHDFNGFRLTGCYEGEEYSVEFPVKSLYACHVEFDYLHKYGDCVDLNTLTDTYYVYPQGNDFSVTKISFATEELYRLYKEEQSKNPESELVRSRTSRFRKCKD